ncbi:hypothetical protein [Rhizobium yanglingense]
MQAVATPEVFVYIRAIMAMVIGLSLTRLLTGLAGIVQSPKKHRGRLHIYGSDWFHPSSFLCRSQESSHHSATERPIISHINPSAKSHGYRTMECRTSRAVRTCFNRLE